MLAANKLVYNKDVDADAIIECICGFIYQFFNLFMANIGVNLLGLLYVEAEILRRGNKELLDEMREGIIIMNKESGMVLFVNKAARAQKIQEKAELSLRLLDDGNYMFDSNSKLFALVDIKTYERNSSDANGLI